MSQIIDINQCYNVVFIDWCDNILHLELNLCNMHASTCYLFRLLTNQCYKYVVFIDWCNNILYLELSLCNMHASTMYILSFHRSLAKSMVGYNVDLLRLMWQHSQSLWSSCMHASTINNNRNSYFNLSTDTMHTIP